MQSDGFIEGKRGLVIRPHVERYVVASALLGIFNDVIIECLTDTLAADILVHAKVVDIKCLNVDQDIVALVLDEYAKGISENLAVAFGNEYRAGNIREDGIKLGVGILLCSAFEKIGAGVMMDFEDLRKQLAESRFVFSFRASYLHFNK